MDLRVKKTQNSIKTAFYQLRRKRSLDKISVKELSEHAMINKATFYLHYKDIYDLSDRLENELVDGIIGELTAINISYTKTGLRLLSEILSRSITAHIAEIRILYSGMDNNRFVYALEDKLKKYLFSRFPELTNDYETNIVLTFLIEGSYYAHIRNVAAGPEMLRITTSRLVERMMD